ncbi:MAG TPA: hypothetical protein VFL96_13105 [Acidobacteriaceae bacterium]|nr:hypothetical protein [Acidobacteriaceae bacterium]
MRAEHEPIDFMQGQVGQANIYTKLIGSETELRLTDHPGADYFPAWSPDGRYIAFYRDEPGASGIYLVSALGGAERRISTEKVGDGGIRWLSDGQHVVVSRLSEDSQRPALIEIGLDTGQERRMTFPPSGAVGDGWPAISPDGKTLAFLRGTKSDGVHACFMELASRQTLQCWPLKASWPEGVAWTEAGDGIIVSAMRGGAHRLWRYHVNGGAPAALTSGEEGAVLPAVSSRGNQLAYVLLRNNINLWQLDIEAFKSLNPDAANPITPSTRYEIDPAFSPDGRKIAFMSDRSGSQEIWVTDLATHSSTQLTQIEGPMTGSPSWSPDGSQIAFDSDQSGGNLFVISADGGTPRRIDKPSSGENCCPSWSRDGQFIYFASSRTGKFQVWKTSAAAGETSSRPAVQVTQGGGFRAFESADGQYLYYAKGREERGLWRRDLTLPGKEEPVLESLQDAGWWALAPGVVYFLELPESVDHRIRLKALDTASLEVRELAALPYPVIRYTRAIAASRDGRHLAYVQVASLDSDIMLLQNFR